MNTILRRLGAIYDTCILCLNIGSISPKSKDILNVLSLNKLKYETLAAGILILRSEA